ncbi:nucleotidyltransferase domain-containing protein [Lutibacter sp.]
MNNTTLKTIIEETIAEYGFKVNRIVLFGSRARGKSTPLSDYDVLVVVEGEITIQEKRQLSKHLRSEFAHRHVDLDVILKSTREFEQSLSRTGSVVKQAVDEGTSL